MEKKLLETEERRCLLGESIFVNPEGGVDRRTGKQMSYGIGSCATQEARHFSWGLLRAEKATDGHVAVEMESEKMPPLSLRQRSR